MDKFTDKIDKILEAITAGETEIYNSENDHEEEEEMGAADAQQLAAGTTGPSGANNPSGMTDSVAIAQQLATKAKNPQAMQAQTQMHQAYTQLMQGLAQKLKTTTTSLNKAA